MSASFSEDIKLTSPRATADLAAAIGAVLVPGDVVLLSGDVGAGKTHFARALIQARLAAAGLAEDVPSPTYTLVQTYHDGICEIWHSDLYRLGDVSEVPELGLTDAFQDAICLIEWPDRLGEFKPNAPLSITLSTTNTPGERVLTACGAVPRWNKILAVVSKTPK